MYTLDVESFEIEDGSPCLPEPVGCSIRFPDGHSNYYAWGHPTGNNCTKEDFGVLLRSIWNERWLTQNGCNFDVPVLAHHFGLPERDPLLTEDTLFASYLHNPYARSLSLKPLCEDWLGMPPDEQQELYDWIMAYTDCRSRKSAGAWIAHTPADLCGKYAVGDTDRTFALWEHVSPLVFPSMLEPYQREQRLAPVLVDIRDRGVRCDLQRLKEDYATAMLKRDELDRMIRVKLWAPDLNPGSNEELGAALLARGCRGFLLTPKGKVSMAKPSLEAALASEPELQVMLSSRSTYDTLIGTFMGPWIKYAEKNNGRIHASYSQVRDPDDYGTRTGRLSSSRPNFQNVPNNLGMDFFGDPFPEMRSYLLPEEGQVWVCGDFKNQEPRLTAHFEDGRLLEAFNADHMLDPYIFVRDVCGLPKDKGGRKHAKAIFLGLVYAMGIQKLADDLGLTYEQAASLKRTVLGAIPDVADLISDCRKRFKIGLPIRTLGGRLYYCEPPSNGRSYEYKSINTLVQGSAADQTKEALIYAHPRLRAIGGRLLGTVHDEYSASVFEKDVDRTMDMMQKSANALQCDVPMVMDICVGKNWAEASPK